MDSDIEDLDRLKEERRRRREEIMEKYRERQGRSDMRAADVPAKKPSSSSEPLKSNGFEMKREWEQITVDDQDDMFADIDVVAPIAQVSDTAHRNEERVPVNHRPHPKSQSDDPVDARHENEWDDADGYYIPHPSEVILGRYTHLIELGRGVFSSVLGATDSLSSTDETEQRVAIKVIRRNELMLKSGQQERRILKLISELDPHSRRHCLRMLGDFEYRGHLCLVFEHMDMNLRDVLRKFGGTRGLNVKAVQIYARHLLEALGLLKQCRVVHADIKPDNMLVSADKMTLKLADFGCAFEVGQQQVTQYAVSRFYRAPEIIIQCGCDFGIDMWSVGCTLFELVTSRILFPGKTHHHMLKMMMETRGRFPVKVLRRGALTHLYFDLGPDGKSGDAHVRFLDRIVDPSSSSASSWSSSSVSVKRIVPPLKPTREIKSLILNEQERDRVLALGDARVMEEQMKLMNQLIDLLEKMLVLNPDKRIRVADAIRHPFITNTTSH